MIQIVDFKEEYMEALEDLDEDMALKVSEHGDVFQDTVICALSDGEFAGAGYLMAGASFAELDRDLPYYHVNLEFKAVPGSDEEVEASAGLLGTLMQQFIGLQEKLKGKRLLLRTWCSAEDTAYLEFMCSLGFAPKRVMLCMEQYLVEDPEEEVEDPAEFFEDEAMHLETLDFSDEDMVRSYLDLNREAFLVQDSYEELMYRADCCGAQVFLLMRGDRILSSVTVWNADAPYEIEWEDGMLSTENIFTAREERKKGYAEYLLTKVMKILADEGASKVTLNVYADDMPAVSLYQKLAYETTDEVLELHFETEPEYLPY